MTTLVPGDHPALEYPEAERRDYLTVVASMAFADGEVTADERARLEEMCSDFKLSEGSREQVFDSAEHPNAAELGLILARMKTSELRFALLVDLIDVAIADGTIATGEDAELQSLAEELDITYGQLVMTRRYVVEQRESETDQASPETEAELAEAGVKTSWLGNFFSLRWLRGKRDSADKDDA